MLTIDLKIPMRRRVGDFIIYACPVSGHELLPRIVLVECFAMLVGALQMAQHENLRLIMS
jgi:hypothetical protein